MRASRALPLALACLMLAAGCGSTGTAEKRSDFVGIVTEDVFGGDERYREQTLEKQVDAGVGLIRQTFDWTKIETRRGQYDFSAYDSWMEKLAEQRMQVLPILFGTPEFYSSKPARGARRGTYPPRRVEDFASFATVVAERYGPGGSFWDAYDGPATPIRSWQIWNEPNLPVYWRSGPDAEEYVALLKAGWRAIKLVDPRAEIVTAGLPQSDSGVPFATYLDQMLDANAAEFADAFAIHPYSTGVGGAMRAVRHMRDELRRRDREEPIWLTEIGWATQGPKSAFTVGMRGQADRITGLFSEVARLRRELGIRGVVYYNWRDSQPFEGGFDFFGLHTGLLTLNEVEKPGYAAFERGVERLAR